MPEKHPRDIVAGDAFTVPAGPYRGLKVEAIGPAIPGKFGSYNVPVTITTPVQIGLDYTRKVEVADA